MEIPKNRHKTPEDLAGEFERQRELYRRGKNYKNIRKQRSTREAAAPPFVPARPETVSRELAKMRAIINGGGVSDE